MKRKLSQPDDEKDAMEWGEEQGVGKFYTLYKVHKPQQAPNCPPETPIISCSAVVALLNILKDLWIIISNP